MIRRCEIVSLSVQSNNANSGRTPIYFNIVCENAMSGVVIIEVGSTRLHTLWPNPDRTGS